MAAVWTCQKQWHTEYSADSVEWCPVEPYTDVLVCGTYQLMKDEETISDRPRRLGKIYLFKFDANSTHLELLQTIDTVGILDQKWCYHTIQGFPVLGAVSSEGFIQLYRLIVGETLSLQLWLEAGIREDVLGLSLDWSTNKVHEEEPRLVVSDSKGNISLWRICGDTLKMITDYKAHGFEAWIAAFDYWNANVVYSGGDDCVLQCYDVRMCSPVTYRTHDAGVTAIRSNLEVENLIITGSYDEKVRLWDTRNLRRPRTDVDAKGGVWRLKWHPYKHDIILAACMYGGFRVLRNGGELAILGEYLQHESIAYGADWKFCDSNTIATCSFYDCKMHISQIID